MTSVPWVGFVTTAAVSGFPSRSVSFASTPFVASTMSATSSVVLYVSSTATGGWLTGVTVMATVELVDSYTDLQFSPQGVAFLTDAILMQRYVELEGQLRRAISVVKVRSSPHSKDVREYEITQDGVIVTGRAIKGYEGILSGAPNKLAVQRSPVGKKSVRKRPAR